MAKLSRFDWLNLRFPGPDVPAGYRLREAGERIGHRDIVLVNTFGENPNRVPTWTAACANAGRIISPAFIQKYATRSAKRNLRPETPFRRYAIDEASKALSFTETNDCAVIALREATGFSYRDCHAFWELHGARKNRQGTYVNRVFNRTGSREFPELGFRATSATHWSDQHAAQNNAELAAVATRFCGVSAEKAPVSHCRAKERLTLARFLKKFPVGRWFLCTSSHAFAVVDGVVVDHGSKAKVRCSLTDAWLITPLSPVAP